MEYIFKSEKSLMQIQKIRAFLVSDSWFIVLSVIAGIFACLHSLYPNENYHIWGTVLLAYITGFCFLFSGDVFVMLTPALFTYMIAMRCYNSLDSFMSIIWLAIPLVAIAIFNLVVYHKKPTIKGSQFKPMLLVSIAVTIGGVGFISPEDYFSGTALYHMLGLGFGMLLIYCYFYAKIEVDNNKYSLIDRLTHLMVVIGLFGAFMVIIHYVININKVIDVGGIIYIRWRNNLSTILMITMPFAFFMGNKKSYATIFAFILYLGMLLTGSRGGMIFGSIEIFMCVVMFVLYDRRRRLAYGIICACILFVALVYFPQITQFLSYTIERVFSVLNEFLMGGADTETRVRHYARGVEDFLNHPILGTGLGYMGNRDIFQNKPGSLCWYHCEPIQIAASFGVLGIGAFVYQFIKRLSLIWKKATLFNMTVFLSYFSLEMMSLVNPGIFCPMPYLLLIVIFLIVVEKCKDGEEQEKIPILKKFKKVFGIKKKA